MREGVLGDKKEMLQNQTFSN